MNFYLNIKCYHIWFVYYRVCYYLTLAFKFVEMLFSILSLSFFNICCSSFMDCLTNINKVSKTPVSYAIQEVFKHCDQRRDLIMSCPINLPGGSNSQPRLTAFCGSCLYDIFSR